LSVWTFGNTDNSLIYQAIINFYDMFFVYVSTPDTDGYP
jgi:hypothetical protein